MRIIRNLLWICSLVLLAGPLPADSGDGLELPPPPSVPLDSIQTASATGAATRQIAALRTGSALAVDEAEQLWPKPEAEEDSTPASQALVTGDGLPPGVQANPNLAYQAGPQSGAPQQATAPAANTAELGSMLENLKQSAPRRSALESALFAQLRAALPTGSTGYVFEKATLPADLKLPRTPFEVRYDFRMPQRGLGAVPFTGNLVDPNGQVLTRFSGSAWIDREASGVQATRVIPRGDTIQPGDVQLLGTRLSQLPRGAVDSAEMLIGTQAKSELRPGAWLTDQMVKSAEIMRRDQAVTIRLTRGPLEITVPGVAKQSGAMGQVIKIENTQSHREVFGRVTAKDTVEVVN